MSDDPLRENVGATAHEVVAETTVILVKALRALGQSGLPDAASRLGAKAWWVLREEHPREAEHVNGVLHFLARLPVEEGARVASAPHTQEET